MADNAIAAQINPSAGFSRISDLIGLQSGMLGLQQQKQALQGQAALVQQEQLKAQAAQGASDYIGAHSVGDFLGSDGTLDANAYLNHQDLKSQPGNVQAAVQDYALNVKQKQLSNATTLQALDANTNQFVQSQLGSVASSPAARALEANSNDKNAFAAVRQQTQDMFDRWKQLGNPELSKVAATYGQIANADPKTIVSGLRAMNSSALTAAERLPAQTGVQTATGYQFGTREPTSGQVSLNGPFVPRGIGPTESLDYQRQLAAGTGLGAGSATDITQHYAGVQNEAQKAETFTGIARNVQDFAHKAITGTPEQRLNLMNGMLAYMGIPGAKDAKTASDLLEKNMAQLNLQGNTATDFKAMVTQMAQPHMSMSEEAIKQAAGQLIGQVQMKKAIGTSLTNEYNHALATGDQTLYRAKRDAISNISDARVWEFKSLTPEERVKFRAKLSAQDDAELGQKFKAAKALGLLQ